MRPIVPVVFYQGERTWNYSTEFADLFPEGVRWLSWVPRFAHALLDQTTLAPGSVSGGVKGRLVQLLMMAAFGRHEEEALALTARLLSLLPAGGGVDDARPFFAYLAGTQESEAMAGFQAALRRHGSQRGEELMTYAEELLAQGRAEGLMEGERRGERRGEQRGEQRGKVEVVEGLLRVGVAWEVIEAATGLTEAGFQELKAHLSQAGC